jgi:hypothetical protein
MISFAELVSAQPANMLAESEAREGWKLLFDGKTTAGWRGYDMVTMPAGWSASGDCLVTSGAGSDLAGDIITTEKFEDFDLVLEWAISPGGNSGIFFHVLEGEYPAAYATGPEYQLIDDEGFPQHLEEWQQTGANYAMHSADKTKKHLKPVGEFNQSRIRVEDGRVTHWLNGEKIVEYVLWTDEWYRLAKEGKWKDYPGYGLARKGHIGLQDHGSKVRFRNIRIKDLTDPGEMLFNGRNLEGWQSFGKELWSVKDSILTGESRSGEYGYFATVKNYDDFVLRLKFRLQSDGNSGVFFRSVIKGTDITGWQVEVAPPGNNTGGIYESGGRGWLAEVPEDREDILIPGDWNDLVMLVRGDRVMTWLNDEMMTDLRDEKIGKGKGKIALQVHSGGGVAVEWKDIRLRRMEN